MPMSELRYAAGRPQAQRHVLELPFRDRHMDTTQAALIARFIEFWCLQMCRGRWRLEEWNTGLRLSFAQPRDVVMFKLSSEYAEFAGGWSRREPV